MNKPLNLESTTQRLFKNHSRLSVSSFSEATMEEDEPCAKRKKQLSGREIIEKLDSNENDVKKAVGAMLEELCPFNINDEDALKIEDRVERLAKVSKVFESKVYRLRKDVKERKFRHNPESLEEPMISCSQHSIFDSQEVSDAMKEIEDEVMKEGESLKEKTNGERAEKYEKKPLDMDLSKQTRRRRVAEKRVVLKQWADEEKVTVSQLLGYLLYVENWMMEKSLAGVGWQVFSGEVPEGKPQMSLEEAIWLREKSGMSEAILQEVRLRLLDR